MQTSALTQIVLPFSLFLIMLGMGLALKPQDFSLVIKQPKAAAVGIACQMLLLPLIGYLIVVVFGLSAELAVGVMILTLCPGGATSNMFSYLARGDVALSISLTAVVSLLTPFTIPLFTVLAMEFLLAESQAFSIPLVKTILQLIVITIVPVAIGMAIHHRLPNFSRRAQKSVKIFSVVFLFIIIAGIVAKEGAKMADYFLQTGLATLSLNVATLIFGFVIAKKIGLGKPQATSIAIEVGIQNGTLALFVAGTILQNAVMTTPAVTYSLIMFATGGVFAWWVSRSAEG